jgi:hypothetical protein
MGRRENVLIPNVSIGGDRLDRFITASTAAKTASPGIATAEKARLPTRYQSVNN